MRKGFEEEGSSAEADFCHHEMKHNRTVYYTYIHTPLGSRLCR